MSNIRSKYNTLFIGSFLSKTRGTKGVSETIAENLAVDKVNVKLSSHEENKYLRLLHIIWDVLTFRGQLIHIDVFSGNGFNIAWIVSKLIQTKRIALTLHGGRLIEYYQAHRSKVEQLLKKASHIQTPSQYLQKHFKNRGFEVSYLPNPINLNRFPYQYKAKGEARLLWVRGFSFIYNPTTAVETVALVKQQYPYVHLTMIGPDRGLKKDCVALAEQLQVQDQISFLGPVPNENLYQHYHAHDVFLNTTSYESFGLAVVEAASCGIPIVSSKVGELPLIWEEGEDILFAEKLEAKAFADQVIRLLENRDLHLQLSQKARQKAESFSWEHLKPNWIKLIDGNGRV